MLDSSKISVVVQGPIVPQTADCLKSIRKYLPLAQIILSTWEYSFVENLDYDNIVFSQIPINNWDMFIPGNKENWSKPNNIDKQIVSTNSGIKFANRKYTLKWRTDFILSSDALFKDYFEIIKLTPQYDKDWKIFTQRILTIGTGNIEKMGLAFHLADYIAFGLTEDIKELWNIPLIDDEYANYGINNKIDEFHHFNFRYAAEQKLLLDNLDKKHIHYHKPNNYFDISNEIKEDSEKALVNNFIFYNYTKSGIISKFKWMDTQNDGFSYSLKDFFNLYDQYIEKLSDRQKTIIKKLLKEKREKRKINKIFNFTKKKEINEESIVFYLFGLKVFSFSKNIEHGILKFKLLFFKFKTHYNTNIIKIGRRVSPRSKYKIKIIGNNNKVIIKDNVVINKINVEIFGDNNIIVIHKNCFQISNTKFIIYGNNNAIQIGQDAHYIGNSLIYLPNFYDYRNVYIGQNAMIMGAEIYCEENYNYIDIGNNLTCSDGVLIQNSDGHVIYDSKTHIALNRAKQGIKIEDDVWIGRRAVILKNTHINKGSILASNSTMVKSFNEAMCVLAGNPAKIVKHDIHWTRCQFRQFKDFIGED